MVGSVVEPLGVAGIVGGLEESAPIVDGEVGGDRSSNRDLVSILHVGSNARSVENHRDVQCFELGSGADSGELQELRGVECPDSGELQELRGVECPTGEDDFASGKERSGARLVRSCGVGISAVQMASLDIANSDGAGSGRCAIKDNAGDEGTELDGELKLLGRVEDHHPLAGTSTRRVGDRERDLVDSGSVVAGWRSVVDVGDHHGCYEVDRVDHASS